ncbi:MAG: hypothetical protein HYV94_01390 [Candidatus Rokubacteria bacterium]|nr:hypothetical protein [Candidatus Rokubacteria bacterium]MBI2490754.1 hypothetical protein [Candidatus Rokubacteria bacterium]MBI4627348.1 hypothetical protein [Candidatus Rokubacteria bacterium]
MWGFWWIFPLIGFTICLVFVIAMVRAMSSGRGFMCMGGHDRGPDETAELRREVRELREEISRLKGAR